jgi:hypothetical protein
MSILEDKSIDIIGTDESTATVVLTISDHLDWRNEVEHLLALQAKINGYVEFIESGQISVVFPDIIFSSGQIRIDIISKFDYPPTALKFLEKVRPILESLNVQITQRLL